MQVIHLSCAKSNGTSRAWLFDQYGRIILERPLQPGLNTIAMRSLPTGTYMIRVQAGSGETYNQKLVKQ